jgi:putative phosphoesterase
MTKIGLISDTHALVPKQVYKFFKDVDIILHAGDIGSQDVLLELENFKKTIAVLGNIDAQWDFPQLKVVEIINIENVKVMMTHIGGYPQHYAKTMCKLIEQERPKLYISGHSHILKVIYDDKYQLLHLNPGAAGLSGWHLKRTLLRFEIEGEKIQNLDILEFDK